VEGQKQVHTERVLDLEKKIEELHKKLSWYESRLHECAKNHQKLVSNNSELADCLIRVALSLSNETMSLPCDLAGTVAALEKKVVLFQKQLSMAEKQFLFPLWEFLATQQAFSIAELIPNWNSGRIKDRCINSQDDTAATKKAAWLQALQMLVKAGKVVCCISDGVTVESISTQDAVDFLELLKYTNIKRLCDIIKKGSDDEKWKEAHHKLNRWYFELKEEQQVSGTPGQENTLITVDLVECEAEHTKYCGVYCTTCLEDKKLDEHSPDVCQYCKEDKKIAPKEFVTEQQYIYYLSNNGKDQVVCDCCTESFEVVSTGLARSNLPWKPYTY